MAENILDNYFPGLSIPSQEPDPSFFSRAIEPEELLSVDQQLDVATLLPESIHLESIFKRFLLDKPRDPEDIQKFFYTFVDESLNRLSYFLDLIIPWGLIREDCFEDDLASVEELCERLTKQIRESLGIREIDPGGRFDEFLSDCGVKKLLADSPRSLLEDIARRMQEKHLWTPVEVEQYSRQDSDTKGDSQNHQLDTPISQGVLSSRLIPENAKNIGKDAVRRIPRNQRRHQLWKHSTISRDETSASDFPRQRVAILFLQQELRRRSPVKSPEETSEPPATHSKHLQKTKSPRASLSSMKFFLGFNAQGNLQSTLQSTGLSKAVTNSAIHAPRIKDTMSPKQEGESDQREPGLPDTNSKDGSRPVSERVSDAVTQSPPPGTSSAANHQHLLDRITSLEMENQSLKTRETSSEKWKVIHCLMDKEGNTVGSYFDKPVWVSGLRQEDYSLKATLPVTDVTGYIEKTGHDFVVTRYYSEEALIDQVRKALARHATPPEPQHSHEYIEIESDRLAWAVERFLSEQPTFTKDFPKFKVRNRIKAPYLVWYLYRSPEALDCLSTPDQKTMRLLTDWIESAYGELYKLAKTYMDKRVVTLSTMPFLVIRGDAVIWQEKGDWNAAVARTLLRQTTTPILHWDRERTSWTKNFMSNASIEESAEFSTSWEFKTWRFYYNGAFLREKKNRTITFKAEFLDEEVDIRRLNLYPLRFADEKVKSMLENRGKRFWSCRDRSFVSYRGDAGLYGHGERFMVDFNTYKELHEESENFQSTYDSGDCEKDSMDPEEAKAEHPPRAPEIYVFPREIPGYNLRSKKWVDLKVDLITDVTWNKDAFRYLELEEQTKELVQALVFQHIESERGTDIIHRKRNGLIILLHGGPGTGKTYTAESVAEIAQKPLYVVTCGDIGTDPEKAEKYLESVLYLGKIWGCVVLIDEAEVFLEQRNLNTLERNALVSVFLRVLEYYEGIMILTTNRVGTFDEAFKSRILLSLHYDKLSRVQRKRIWRNFIMRLQNMENNGPEAIAEVNTKDSSSTSAESNFKGKAADIDYQDILDYVDELSEHELNGRQIRNTITTARQLTKFRGQTLKHQQLQEVIKVSAKFDQHLKQINENMSDDQIARDLGLR